MKILIIGATGTIGKHITAALQKDHDDPILTGTSISTMNGAINGFVKGAAIELENGVRINAVGPDIVEESTACFSYFPGHVPVTMSRVTHAYIKSALGGQTGQIYKVL